MWRSRQGILISEYRIYNDAVDIGDSEVSEFVKSKEREFEGYDGYGALKTHRKCIHLHNKTTCEYCRTRLSYSKLRSPKKEVFGSWSLSYSSTSKSMYEVGRGRGC